MFKEENEEHEFKMQMIKDFFKGKFEHAGYY